MWEGTFAELGLGHVGVVLLVVRVRRHGDARVDPNLPRGPMF